MPQSERNDAAAAAFAKDEKTPNVRLKCLLTFSFELLIQPI